MDQHVISEPLCHRQMERILRGLGVAKYLLVCDAAYPHLPLGRHLDAIPIAREVFCEFTANPRYEAVCQGVERFRDSGCEGIVAVGGGSTMDVAKCIKAFVGLDPQVDYLNQPFCDSGIPLITLPTTAGTGSESTHFAVIYNKGEKLSIAHESLLPNTIFLDATALETLPLFQKKCTLLDALCQGIESWWSIHATEDSIAHARAAVEGIVQGMDSYLGTWDAETAQRILLAANQAGRAINLTQTTAPHAMSYKITSLYGLPHGYAVALCLPKVWRYMLEHPVLCVHPKGWRGLQAVFEDISRALGQACPAQAVEYLEALLEQLGLTRPCAADPAELNVLTLSVNTQRLGNNPVTLTEDSLEALYRQIVEISPKQEA